MFLYRALFSTGKTSLKNYEILRFTQSAKLINSDDGSMSEAMSITDILNEFDLKKYEVRLVSHEPAIVKIYNKSEEFEKAKTLRKMLSIQRRETQIKNVGKEIHVGTSIGTNDLKTKITQSAEFLNTGHRVKFVVEPKGIQAKIATSKYALKDNILKHLTEMDVNFEMIDEPTLADNKLSFSLVSKFQKANKKMGEKGS